MFKQIKPKAFKGIFIKFARNLNVSNVKEYFQSTGVLFTREHTKNGELGHFFHLKMSFVSKKVI